MAYINTNLSTPAKAPSRLSPMSRLIRILDVWRQRQDLGRLSADQLHDIGVTRDEAHSETSRPFWDVPHHWR